LIKVKIMISFKNSSG